MKNSAILLGGALLGGIAGLAIFARVDRERVGVLEHFTETSAVGDKTYYRIPEPPPEPPVAVAKLAGEALVPPSYAKFEWRDTKMRPVARDPQTRLTIYATREPLPEAKPGETLYFVKTAANEYLRLRAAR